MAFRRSRECGVEICGRPHLQRLKLDPKCSGRDHRLLEYERRMRIGRIPQDSHARNSWEELFEQF